MSSRDPFATFNDNDRSDATSGESQPANIDELLFVGFNSRVIALDRNSGDLVWSWKSPKGTGYVAVLLDGDRLIASVQGYMYCLDPISGQEIWKNPLKGMGVGVPCLASVNGSTQAWSSAAQRAAEEQQARQSQAHT